MISELSSERVISEGCVRCGHEFSPEELRMLLRRAVVLDKMVAFFCPTCVQRTLEDLLKLIIDNNADSLVVFLSQYRGVEQPGSSLRS